ncbi:MAG: TRAP-type mannitol/chloroaromatic compound transport system permease small subunit [Paracoccaceae bacterium]|jgi:TRAP-type mannitol/chloroaromatic compound transport system permease small subunit
MSAHSVREDGSAVSIADRLLFKVESLLNLAGGLCILGVMLMSVANILGRKLFDMPVPGYIDWMMQLVPAMAFLGIAYTQRLGGHIRMDILVARLQGRTLWIAEFASVLLMLLLALALVYGSWDHAYRAITLGDSTVDINLPTWPVKVLVSFMLGMFALRCMLQLWAYAIAIVTGVREPMAIPLIEDAATQAMNEAETVSGMVDEQMDNAPANGAGGPR